MAFVLQSAPIGLDCLVHPWVRPCLPFTSRTRPPFRYLGVSSYTPPSLAQKPTCSGLCFFNPIRVFLFNFTFFFSSMHIGRNNRHGSFESPCPVFLSCAFPPFLILRHEREARIAPHPDFVSVCFGVSFSVRISGRLMLSDAHGPSADAEPRSEEVPPRRASLGKSGRERVSLRCRGVFATP